MHSFSDKAGSLYAYPRRNFGLYGFDIMFTSKGEPMLIEINSSPATGTSTQLDVDVKFELLSDLLHLVGINCNLNQEDEIIYPERFISPDAAALASTRGICGEGIDQFVLNPNEEMFSGSVENLRDADGKYKVPDYRHLTRFERRALL